MERHSQMNKVSADVGSREINKEKYVERFGSIINHGFVALGIAAGHKLGLVKAFGDFKTPVSSQELADHMHFKERYVREWLGSMVAAEIVLMTEDNRYYIPHEVLPDIDSLAMFSTLLPATAKRIDDLYNCFQLDGPTGFDYSKQRDIHIFLEEEKVQHDGKWLDDNLVPHSLKKKDEIKKILDVGCGTGRTSINIAKHFPDAHVIAIDVVDFAIETANRAKGNENITNVEFVKVGAEAMSTTWDNTFDWVVAMDTLHDLPDLENSIKCIRRVLKDDGVLTAVEPPVNSDHKDNIGLEMPAAMLSVSCFVCLPCSMSSGSLAGNGVGWGVQNRASFLKCHGFKIFGEEHTGLIHCKKA